MKRNIPVKPGFLPIKPITSTTMTNFESKQSDSRESHEVTCLRVVNVAIAL